VGWDFAIGFSEGSSKRKGSTYISAMYQSVAMLTAARVVDMAARYLRLMHSPPSARASASQMAFIGSHCTSWNMPVDTEVSVTSRSAM
jgi:hypothetical protein